jgi:hypothetical protein
MDDAAWLTVHRQQFGALSAEHVTARLAVKDEELTVKDEELADKNKKLTDALVQAGLAQAQLQAASDASSDSGAERRARKRVKDECEEAASRPGSSSEPSPKRAKNGKAARVDPTHISWYKQRKNVPFNTVSS